MSDQPLVVYCPTCRGFIAVSSANPPSKDFQQTMASGLAAGATVERWTLKSLRASKSCDCGLLAKMRKDGERRERLARRGKPSHNPRQRRL